MGKQPIEIFHENYHEFLTDIERIRQQNATSPTTHCSLSITVSEERSKTAVVEDLYEHTRNLVQEAKKGNDERLEKEANIIIHGCLDYLEIWGGNTPVTAHERETYQDDVTVIQRPPIVRLKELFEEKGDDYEMDEITYLSYCIMGRWSVIHEVHKKAQRFYSVTVDEDPKFEEAEDTAFDLCNYALYLLAYSALPNELSYDWVIHDLR